MVLCFHIRLLLYLDGRDLPVWMCAVIFAIVLENRST